MKTEDLFEAEAFLGDLVRNVDSSLLDEWEKLRNPDPLPEREKTIAEHKTAAFTRNPPAFTRAVRNAVFDLVKALARDDIPAALARIEPADSEGAPWTRERLDILLDGYFQTHQRIRLDPEARAAKHTHITRDSPRLWQVGQVLVDPDELNDWSLAMRVNLDACDAAAAVVLTLDGFSSI